MSIPNLPVDFKDDILNTGVNQKRKYQQTYNSDGSVSFEDVTAYQQKGSNFGAQEVNETNEAVNNIYAERIVDLDELELVTEPGFFVDALAVKELNSNKKDSIISDEYYKDNQTIPANSSVTIQVSVPVKTGYSRCVWTARATNASSNGNGSSYACVYSTNLTANDDHVDVGIRNYANVSIKIRVSVRMMYVRNDLL